MHQNNCLLRRLACAGTILIAVAAAGVPAARAAARLSNAALLSSQLPRGETLATASMKEVEVAVRAAATRRPAAAADILKIAILAKTPKRRPISCESVRELVSFAVGGAPDQAREITEMALSLAPDCEAAISSGSRNPTTGGATGTIGAGVPGSTTGETSGSDGSDGVGPGAPGSPGFAGSSPSGGFALQPTTPAVTSTVND